MPAHRPTRRINPVPLPPIPCFSGPNACDPAVLSPRDRRREITQILARGVARLILARRRGPGRAFVVPPTV